MNNENKRPLTKEEQKKITSLLNAYDALSGDLKDTIGKDIMKQVDEIYNSTIIKSDNEVKKEIKVPEKKTIYDRIKMSKKQADILTIVSISLLALALLGTIIYAIIVKK